MIDIMAGRVKGLGNTLPPIVSFYGAERGLGASMLAYGTGAALAAHSVVASDATEPTVYVIDLQGAENFEKWRDKGWTVLRRNVVVQPPVRKLRAQRDDGRVGYCQLQVPKELGWPAGLAVVWPSWAQLWLVAHRTNTGSPPIRYGYDHRD